MTSTGASSRGPRVTRESDAPVETDNLFSEKRYFDWLCAHIEIPWVDKEYETLLSIMFSTEFVWVVGNDENRISDGRALRIEYIRDTGQGGFIGTEPVNFLEVLIGISQRISFLVDQEPEVWAWNLIRNLRLGGFSDPLSGQEVRKVMDILEKIVWRRYNPDGSGGFFPLAVPLRDQRKVEIWDQMNAYIQENRALFGL